MLLDFVLGAVFVLSLLFGALRGALRQTAQMIAIATAYVAAQPLGPGLQASLPSSFHGRGLPERELATIGAFVLVWLLLTIVFGALIRSFLAGNDLHRRQLDRMFGSALAGVRVAISIYLILCAVSVARGEPGSPAAWADQSSLYCWTSRHNVFQANSQLLANLGVDPQWSLFPKFQSARAFDALSESPKFKEILARPEMKDAVTGGGVRELLKKLLEETQSDHQREIEEAVSDR